MNECEALVASYGNGKSELHRESLSYCHIVHQKSHTDGPGTMPRPCIEKPLANNLSHGMAQKMISMTLVMRFEILLRENTKISVTRHARRLQSCYLSYSYHTLIDIMRSRFVCVLHVKFQVETFMDNNSSY